MYLLNAREMKLFLQLAEKMAKAGKEGTFQTWMLQESDLIQGAARAYGERLVSEKYGSCRLRCGDCCTPYQSFEKDH